MERTAVAIAADVRAGRSSARAEIEAALARIEAADPALNALTLVRGTEALAEADALDAGGPGHDGPLAGVPIAVKEEYAVTGTVTTLGGRGNSTPASADSEVIRRVRAAGGIIVAKTTMPEFGQFPFTESQRYGITRNPWGHDFGPAGSSGGSAVAVAIGLVPIGLGADGGGSIRLPASCTGLVGLKPTRGLISPAPLRQHWFGLVVLGGLTRTVGDQALMLDVIAGSLPTDRWRCEPPSESYAAAAASDPPRLRVAWTTKPVMAGLRTDPQVAAATERIARVLAGLGHRVGHVWPSWPVPTAPFLTQFYAGMREEAGQVEHPELLEPRTRQTARLAAWASPRVVEHALRRAEKIAAALDENVLGAADVMLLPAMPRTTPRVGLLDGLDTVRAQLVSTPYVSNAAIFNVSGHPALVVPAGLDDHGIPIGVQLVARRGRDDLLLAVAGELERAGAWAALDAG